MPIGEAMSPNVKRFLKKQERQVNNKKTLFIQSADLLNDEKSVDLMMRDQLHNECFLDRCFKDPLSVKKGVTLVNKALRPRQSKKTKNPIFWKPDPMRLSKHLQEILETHH